MRVEVQDQAFEFLVVGENHVPHQNQQHRERQMQYDPTCMWNPKQTKKLVDKKEEIDILGGRDKNSSKSYI